MKINYKKELEEAARTMILVHKPQTLIRLIVRMVVHKVKVSHAGILLYDQKKHSYILTVSRGKLGVRIPAGFARVDPDNAMIRFLGDHRYAKILNTGSITYNKVSSLLRNKQLLSRHSGLRETLIALKNQMNLFKALVCVPSYFQNKLLGVLLLGKKSTGRPFHRDEIDFFIALSHDVSMAIKNAQLFEELQEQIDYNKRLFLETTKALATTIDAKDHYTHGHTERVTEISLALAKRLIMTHRINVDERFLDDLNIAALLHDIGKIGLPEGILNKRGKLDEEEYRRVKEHPLVGASIIGSIHDLKRAVDGVKYHHEWYNGTGYPEGLKGENIPLIASIIAVADSYDAMSTHRPYRSALTKHKAIEEIKRCSGTQFHPLIARALVDMYHERSL